MDAPHRRTTSKGWRPMQVAAISAAGYFVACCALSVFTVIRDVKAQHVGTSTFVHQFSVTALVLAATFLIGRLANRNAAPSPRKAPREQATDADEV